MVIHAKTHNGLDMNFVKDTMILRHLLLQISAVGANDLLKLKLPNSDLILFKTNT